MTIIEKTPICRLSLVTISLLGVFLLASTITFAQNSPYEVIRLNDGNPIIYPTMFKGWYDRPNVSKDGGGGSNINGPSLIRVPNWIPSTERADPTAQYYLYFAHHAGDYIRMAWAADIEGPYTLYDDYDDVGEVESENPSTILPANLGIRGVLDNGEADIDLVHVDDSDPNPSNWVTTNIKIEENHLASPDVIVDDVNQQIILYFHSGSSYFVNGVEQNDQVSWVATSPYGLEFRNNIQPVHLGSSYFRLFEYGNKLYALDNGANLNRALDVSAPWAIPTGHNFTQQLWDDNPTHIFNDAIPESTSELRVRHTGVRVIGNKLHVFYSRRGDIQERIQLSIVNLTDPNWENWTPTYPPYELLAPNPGWEGGERDLLFSETSDGVNVNQLRDPDFFQDTDGKTYIIYTGNGEDGIGIAKVYGTPTTTTTISTSVDTYIKESKTTPGTFYSQSNLSTTTGNGNPDKRTMYMKFDLTGVAALEHAVVRLYVNETSSITKTNPATNDPRVINGGPVTAYKVSDNSWDQTTLHAGNAPALGDAITTTHITSTGFYDWNITEYAKANIGNSFTIAFDIAPDAPTEGATILPLSIKFDSLDSGLNVPQLLLAATLDSTLSIEDIDSEPVVLALNVYPNPFVDNISIDFSNYDGQNAVLVELINFSGVTIMSKEAFGQKIELSDLALPTGVYILKVTHNGKTSIKKMIKVD